MTIKHYVKFDLSATSARKVVPLSLGDENVHKIIFSIANGSEPVDISSSMNYAAVAVKNGANDGAGVVDTATVNDDYNTVEWIPGADALSVSGNVLSYLTVFNGEGKKLYSPSFYLFVRDNCSEALEEAPIAAPA